MADYKMTSDLTRREFISGAIAVAVCAPTVAVAKSHAKARMRPPEELYFVGTYEKRDRYSPTTLSRERADGPWRRGRLIANMTNSYVAHLAPGSRKLYVLHNIGPDSYFSRHRYTSGGVLTEEGRWSSGGVEPDSFALDATGRYFAIGNSIPAPTNGNVVLFREGATPKIIADLRNHDPRGPDHRQYGSIPHCVMFSPDNRFIYICDKGTDQVLVRSFDESTGAVGPQITAFQSKPASGPRIITFHRNGEFAYVVTELDSTILSFRMRPDGGLTLLERRSSLPEHYTVPGNTYVDLNGDIPPVRGTVGGHIVIHPEKDILYVTNRGQDSIGVFAIERGGTLSPIQWVSSEGRWPWFFLFANPKLLIVADWFSNQLVFFDVDSEGKLRPNGERISVDRPSYLVKLEPLVRA